MYAHVTRYSQLFPPYATIMKYQWVLIHFWKKNHSATHFPVTLTWLILWQQIENASEYNLKHIHPIYNHLFFFFLPPMIFIKTKCDLTLFPSTFKSLKKSSLVRRVTCTCNIVHLLARIHFAFLYGSKNIMLEGEIIELSFMSVGSCSDVSMML